MPFHPDANAQLQDMARQALPLAMRALEAAELDGEPAHQMNALSQVARCLRVLRRFGDAERALQRALRWAAMLPAADAQVDLLCELAELACMTAEHAAERADDDSVDDDAEPRDPAAIGIALDTARDHAYAAARCAGLTTDAHWEVTVLLRVSDVLNRCGDHDDAATMQGRAVGLLGAPHPAPDAGAGAGAGDSIGRPPTNWLM